MANGTKKLELIEEGFGGGFVKSFKKISNRNKRSSDNSTSDVEIDTVILLKLATNATDKTKLESAIKTAASELNLATENITCKNCVFFLIFSIHIFIYIYRVASNK